MYTEGVYATCKLSFLQTEDGFLSNEETKKTLPEILTKILTDLNEKGQCTIPIGEILHSLHYEINALTVTLSF